MKNYIYLVVALLSVFVSACAVTPSEEINEKYTTKTNTNLVLSQERFSALPGWKFDNFQGFAQAYGRSCNGVLKRSSQSFFGGKEKFGKNQEWQIACRKFQKINKNNSTEIQKFFETNFIPYSARANNETSGLFTGYYEAGLNGSRIRSERYKYPLRARPDDLVMVDLGAFRDELKGQRIAGRVKGGHLKPYETHAQIVKGGLPPVQDKPLVWVDSPIDAFFIQIQGSGIVSLNDGSTIRVGYAGQNGHPYCAVWLACLAKCGASSGRRDE